MTADIPALYRCAPMTAQINPGTQVARLPWATIDIHCHILTPSVEALVAQHPRKLAEQRAAVESMGATSLATNKKMLTDLNPQLTDVLQRLRDMDAMGVDVQAVSPSPTQYYSWAEPELADQIAKHQNDAIARLCEEHPTRFVGLGAVPMQYPERAAAQLQDLMCRRGFKGVEISTMVDNRDVADSSFYPFWAKAEELGAAVFIHPWGTTLGSRLAEHYLINTIGQPLETTICLSKLIFSGILDRYKKLKLIAAHGGGYLPFYTGRTNHSRAVRPEVRGCECRPSDYLTRIWFDSLVYEPQSLRRLIDQVGEQNVVLGTDYPFDMGHYDPGTLLASFSELTQRRILGENASRLLGIDLVSQ